MKRIISILVPLFLVLTLTLGTIVSAGAVADDSHGIDALLQEANAERAAYAAQINEIMSELMAEADSSDTAHQANLQGDADVVASYDLDNAYRVSILDSLFLTALAESGDFQATLTDVVQWRVPITTADGEAGFAVLLEEDGELSYVGLVAGEAAKTWYISEEAIRSAVTASDEIQGTLTSMQIVHSFVYYTAFVYLSDGENEYLIPFSYSADECGIENGALYSLSEVERQFNLYYDESQLTDAPLENNGAPVRNSSPAQAVVLVLCIAFAAILVGFGVVLYQRNRASRRYNASC